MFLLFKYPTCLCHQVGPATPNCCNLFMWETLSVNLPGLSKKDVSAHQLPVFVAAPDIEMSFIYNRERSKICLKGYRSNTSRFRLSVQWCWGKNISLNLCSHCILFPAILYHCNWVIRNICKGLNNTAYFLRAPQTPWSSESFQVKLPRLFITKTNFYLKTNHSSQLFWVKENQSILETFTGQSLSVHPVLAAITSTPKLWLHPVNNFLDCSK